MQKFIQKKQIKKYRIYIKTKGFIYFLFFIFVPIGIVFLVVNIMNIISEINNLDFIRQILQESILLISLQYLIFFIFLYLMVKFQKRLLSFINNKNWFYTLGNALIPAIKAYSLGIIITFFFISILQLLPITNKSFHEWINTPNPGYHILFNYLKDHNYIKIFILILNIIIFAPIIEEILFRGFLQDTLKNYFKNYHLDIILTALIFSLSHIVSLPNVIFAFVIGIFLSFERKKHQSINVTIWIHGIINFTGILASIIDYLISNNTLVL